MNYSKYIVVAVSCFFYFSTSAQQIPQDSDIIKGELENGLTYYIKQNSVPSQKVELRLVVNAGSALEDDSQRGLAHFMEHLAFSGTRDFPGLKLIDTLESIGVKFGKELNAYTSFDETVYYLPIPSENIELGLNVLANWAIHLTLTEEAIDRERGVILEEMRLGEGSRKRLQSQYLPVIFEGSPYPNRLPIGIEEVVRNCPYDELHRFYNTWYRPDLMAVIAVGDLDPRKAEALIEQLFSESRPELIMKERASYFPTEHKEPKVVISTDPERKSCTVEISYKHKAKRINTEEDYLGSIKDELYRSILLDRLEIVQDRSSIKFYDAEISYSSHFRFIDTYSLFAFCAMPDVKNVLELLLTENERVKRHGFFSDELERNKKKMLAKYKRWSNEADKTASDLLADTYQVSYLLDQPATSIKWEYDYVKKILKDLTVEQMNLLAESYSPDKNCVISVIGPEEGEYNYPSKQELVSQLKTIGEKEIDPFIGVPDISTLFDKKVKKGKIVKRESIDSLGLIRWTLSNGLNVILKSTNYKNNEVLFRSTSDGGYGMYPGSDVMSAVNATIIQDNSGINNINNIQLKRLMTGKDIAIKQYLTFNNEAMWGKSSIDDIETLFQLINLYHTEPYFDKKASEKVIEKGKLDYSYLRKTPSSSFDYYVDSLMNGGDFRCTPWPLPEMLDMVDIGRSEAIYKDRFSNCSGFTYLFVGNLDLKQISKLVEKYIASLPTDDSKKITTTQYERYIPKGESKHYYKKGDEDKSTVKIRFVKSKDSGLYSKLNYNAFVEILNSRLFESLRMQMSGVYGVHVSGEIPDKNILYSKLNLTFGCDPSMCDTLITRLDQELLRLWEDGPTQEEVEQFKEKSRVSLNSYYKSNAFSLSQLLEKTRENTLPLTLESQQKEIELITIESIKKAAKGNLNPREGHYFIHLPEDDI